MIVSCWSWEVMAKWDQDESRNQCTFTNQRQHLAFRSFYRIIPLILLMHILTSRNHSNYKKITQIGKYPSTQALWLSGNNISYPPWIRATEQTFVLQVALSYVRHQNLISIDYYQQSFLTYYILKAPNRCLFTSIFIRHFQVVHRDLKPHKHKHFSTTQSVITSTYKTISTFRGHIFFHKCILFDKQNRSQLTST